MAEQSWMCVLCTRVEATCFCCCEGRETFLCEDCFCAHYKKNPLQVHIPVPVSAFGQHKNPKYMECLQSRSASIPRAKAEILKNIDAVDQCIAELLQEIEVVVTQLNDFASRTIGQLQDLKSTLQREIYEGIAEVEQTMFEHSPTFTNKWAPIIRNFNGQSTVLACFTYSINSQKVLQALESLFTFAKFGQEVLVGIGGNKLTVHYPLLSQSQHFILPQAFSSSARLCVLSNSQVLALGQKPASKSAFLISLISGDIRETCKMACARTCPGLICVNSTAYAFGGKCVGAEKYLVPMSTWQKLPNADEFLRYPVLCCHKDTIYVFDHLKMRAFHIANETLCDVNATSEFDDVLLACPAGDEIVLVTEDENIYWWNLAAKSLKLQVEGDIQGEITSSQCQPILLGRKVYYMTDALGTIACLDIDLQTVKTIAEQPQKPESAGHQTTLTYNKTSTFMN